MPLENTTLNPGSGGDVISTDLIAGIHHQRVKVQFGADGAAADVSTTAPLPVELRENDGTSLIAANDEAAVDSGMTSMGKARETVPTSVQDGDAVLPMHDLKGRRVTTLSPRELTVVQHTILAGAAEETILAAGAAGIFHDITSLMISTVTGVVLAIVLRDTNGGTILQTLSINAGNALPCLKLSFNPPLKQTSVASNWTISGGNSSVHVTVVAIKTSA